MTTSIALLLATLGSAASQGDAALLVPPDTTVLVRIESPAGLVAFVNSVGAAAGDEESLQAAEFLAGMQCPLEAEALDLGKPMYFVLSIAPNAPVPAMTWIAALADANGAARLESEFSGGPFTPVFHGDYVGLSLRQGYSVQATPSPLVAGLPPGLVSAHVDLGALLAAYRPLIDMGLRTARMEMDSLPVTEDMPFDVSAVMEQYFDGIEVVLDSAQSLGLALECQDKQVAVTLDFLARAGSSLDGWETGPRVDLGPLAGLLDPEASGHMIGAFDWADLHRRLGSFVEAALEMYPEPLATQFTSMWDAQEAVIGSLLPGVASSFDMGVDGFRGTYALRSRDPVATEAAVAAVFETLSTDGGFMRAAKIDPITRGERHATVWKVEMDWKELSQVLARPGDEDGEKVSAMMEQVYGSGLHVALMHQGEIVVLVFGSEDFLRRGLDLVGSKTLFRPGLARALERSGGGTPSMAYHLDFGRFMKSFGAVMATLAPGFPEGMPDVSASVDYWGSIRGALWSGGMAMDLGEFVQFFRAMEELTQAEGR